MLGGYSRSGDASRAINKQSQGQKELRAARVEQAGRLIVPIAETAVP